MLVRCNDSDSISLCLFLPLLVSLSVSLCLTLYLSFALLAYLSFLHHSSLSSYTPIAAAAEPSSGVGIEAAQVDQVPLIYAHDRTLHTAAAAAGDDDSVATAAASADVGDFNGARRWAATALSATYSFAKLSELIIRIRFIRPVFRRKTDDYLLLLLLLLWNRCFFARILTGYQMPSGRYGAPCIGGIR